MEAVPFTAWEQAALIGLFIVFASGVLTLLIKWFNKQTVEWREFMTEERRTSQAHVAEIDDKWRAFNKEQRDTNLEAMNCVEGSLKDLTTVTQGLVSEVREMRDDSKAFYESFHAHDIQAKEILAEVKNGKPAPKPRAKKVDGN